MRTPYKLILATAGWMFWTCAVASAQDDGAKTAEVPNSMGMHTWFIILALGALLAWGISYSLQLQQESIARKMGRDDLARRKEEILDEIAEIESQKDAGELPEPRYKKELKALRLQLSRVVEQLGARG